MDVDSGSESPPVADDPAEDEQLTIRIPNPKVYMARQSLWIGKRGKARCDSCRLQNLKCDRVLPSCNHCSWGTGKECKYTPLPTPAHRGIPRCDRCRVSNLKCDRNLPLCNNCREGNQPDCKYTPKKRNRAVVDLSPPLLEKPAVSVTVSTSSKATDISENGIEQGSPGPSFYGQNVASSSSNLEVNPDRGNIPHSSPGRSVGYYRRRPVPPLPTLAPKPRTANQGSLAPHDTDPIAGLRPWSHASFTPLPENILRNLSVVNGAEMPDRQEFERSLNAFLSSLIPELRETACLAADVYADVARALSKGDLTQLSPRLRGFAAFHHFCTGSDKSHLILVPRESNYDRDLSVIEGLLEEYQAVVDGSSESSPPSKQPPGKDSEEDSGSNVLNWHHEFERLPVQNQIYDILAYAHRGHASAFTMLLDIARQGVATITWPMAELFLRLCPVCSVISRQGALDHMNSDSAQKSGRTPLKLARLPNSA